MGQARRFIALLLLAGWPSFAVGQAETGIPIAGADPVIQAQISAVYNAKSDIEVTQQLQALKELTDDKAELVRQLAIFAVAAPNKKEMHDLITLEFLHRLKLAASIPIRALAPYLGSDNEQLRDFAREWFRGHDTVSTDPLEPVNFREYADYIGQQVAGNEDVPAAFAEYIFERSPERALLAFHRGGRARHTVAQLQAISNAFEARQRGEDAAVEKPEPVDDPPKEILLEAHIVEHAIWLKRYKFDEQFRKALPEAKEQLTKLAERKEWWVRLYVAEIMRRHRELRMDDVLQKLRDDSNESVSKAAEAAG
jgi:hypothetical protein